jgi:hypothetical protein
MRSAEAEKKIRGVYFTVVFSISLLALSAGIVLKCKFKNYTHNG